jgi:MFS family permease
MLLVVCAAGMALTGVASLGFLLLDAGSPIWVLEVLLFLMGTAMAQVMPIATVMIMSSLPREKAGSGSAITNTFHQVGGTLGSVVAGSLMSTAYRNGTGNAFVDAIHVAALSSAAAALVGTLVALLFLPAKDAVPPAAEPWKETAGAASSTDTTSGPRA